MSVKPDMNVSFISPTWSDAVSKSSLIKFILGGIPIAFLIIKDFPEPGDPISKMFPLSFLLILSDPST